MLRKMTDQITRNQLVATAGPADLVAVARGAGIASSRWARDEEGLGRLVEHSLAADRPHFIGARVDASPGAGTLQRNLVVLKEQFMQGIGARAASRGTDEGDS